MATEATQGPQQSGQAWTEDIAPTWERRRGFVEATSAPVREWLVRELAPRPGDTVLELAAGVGDTGFEAATILGEGGRLISTDFSPGMVDAARRRSAELGLGNVEHRVMDAEHIELGDDTVDGVLCRFGYMLMGDPATALAETRRVLRPGGRLALAVWGPPDRNPFFTTVGMTLVRGGHMPPPDPQAPGVFSLGAEERLRGVVTAAGFGDVRIEEVPVTFPVPVADEYLSIVTDTAGPLAIVLRRLTDEQLATVREQVAEALQPFGSDGGYEVPGLALVAVASQDR